MSDRDELLSELRAAHGGIDPVLDQAADYARGVKAVQSVVRSQGQVMSLALKNNEALHHTNKKLVARCRELDAENAELRRGNVHLSQRVEQLQSSLERSGGDRYKALFEGARQALANHLFEAVPEGELQRTLEQMKRQAAELDVLPERATEDEIAARIDGTPTDQSVVYNTWLRNRCYCCGHRLRFSASHCPQCELEFDGRDDPEPMPDTCGCDRCREARAS